MKQFLLNMFSSRSDTSSKRVNGTIGWLAAIVMIAVWEHGLIETLLYVSAGMIGFGAVEKVFSILANKKK